MIIKNIKQAKTSDLSSFADQPLPSKILVVEPNYFDIKYTINPHMNDNIGMVDYNKAISQWLNLVYIYKELKLDVNTHAGQKNMPDMVFCANQALPYLTSEGNNKVVMSRMWATQRVPEVIYLEKWYRQQNYQIIKIPNTIKGSFEGMGDALWHPNKRLLWGGYGYRTSINVYNFLEHVLNIPIIILKLKNPWLYHLDTCLSLLNEDTALLYPDAFAKESIELLNHYISNLIIAPKNETLELLACNAFCPDGKHAIIEKKCKHTISLLEKMNFNVIDIDTSEYLKSGGSVFCMKMTLW